MSFGLGGLPFVLRKDTSVTPIFPLGIVIAMYGSPWMGIGLGIFNGYEVLCAVSSRGKRMSAARCLPPHRSGHPWGEM